MYVYIIFQSLTHVRGLLNAFTEHIQEAPFWVRYNKRCLRIIRERWIDSDFSFRSVFAPRTLLKMLYIKISVLLKRICC